MDARKGETVSLGTVNAHKGVLIILCLFNLNVIVAVKDQPTVNESLQDVGTAVNCPVMQRCHPKLNRTSPTFVIQNCYGKSRN